jgi:predicted transcriptional regulator
MTSAWRTREELAHQVALLAKQGASRRAIARALGVSRNTVRTLLAAHAEMATLRLVTFRQTGSITVTAERLAMSGGSLTSGWRGPPMARSLHIYSRRRSSTSPRDGAIA